MNFLLGNIKDIVEYYIILDNINLYFPPMWPVTSNKNSQLRPEI